MSESTRLTGEQALARLINDCKFVEERARRVLNIAWEFDNKAEPCPGGYVHVYYHGQPGKRASATDRAWSVVEHIGPVTRKWPEEWVATQPEKVYAERNSKKTVTRQRRNEMPPRTRAPKVTEPEPEAAANGSRSKLDNLQRYLEKDPTPVLSDYIEWFGYNVADPDKLSSDKLIELAVTFYGEFQGSDFNKDRRAARRAEREAAAPAEEEPEPAKPAARGRGARTAAKPAAATATPAKRGRKPAAKPASAAAVY